MEEKIIELFNRLLEQLHQTDTDGLCSRSFNLTYVAPGAQNIGRLNTQNNYQTYDPSDSISMPEYDTPPLPETMARAVEKTMAEGYWWASTAWAVVYRVYQIVGYGAGFSQFVKDVASWPHYRSWTYECNFDAVQKPIASGKLSGLPETWKENGAQDQAVRLGLALMEELKKN